MPTPLRTPSSTWLVVGVAALMTIPAGVAAGVLLRGEDVALPDGEEARAAAVA